MYQPKTGQPCSCKRGIQRDNCPSCEGTGMRINFAAIQSLNNDRCADCGVDLLPGVKAMNGEGYTLCMACSLKDSEPKKGK
jgi:hypothetical protein